MYTQKNLLWLKNQLLLKLNKLIKSKTQINNSNFKIEILEIVLESLEVNNYNTIYLNIDIICALLSLVYDKNELENITTKLTKIVYQINKYQNSAYLESETTTLIAEYNDIISSINQDFNNEKDCVSTIESKNDISKLNEYQKLLNYLNFCQFINPTYLKTIFDLLDDIECSSKEKIAIILELEAYNQRIANEVIYNSQIDKKEIIDLLTIGFEKFQMPPLLCSSKKRLQTDASMFINQLEQDFDMIDEILPNSASNYTIEEFNAIMINIIDFYQEKLLDQIELITEKDLYFDEETKNEIIIAAKEIYNKLRIITTYYDEQTKDINIDKTETKESKFNLIYLTSQPNDPSKAYILSDLDTITQECLDATLNLLEQFKNGNMSKVKLLPNDLKDLFYELRYGQIRIIYMHISHNNYAVVGAFIKKKTRDKFQYSKVFKRVYPIDLSTDDLLLQELQYSTKVEEKMKEYVTTNRRGSKEKGC